MIADLHLDLLLDAVRRRAAGERDVFRRRHLPALAAAGVRVQVLPMFVPDELVPDGALRYTLQQIDAARREQEESGGALRIVESAAELHAVLAQHGTVAGILALEGAEALGRDPGLIASLRRLGVRMASLTWNRANEFADGLAEDRGIGLTPLGRRLLAEMEQQGVALDLSHLTPRGCRAALDCFGSPVLASHANARAVHDNPRNLDDELLAAIGERDGVVGLCAVPAFVGSGPFAVRLAAHHRHVAERAGPGAAAFGADFCDYLGDDIGLPLLPDEPSPEDLELARRPEPPRETFYADVLAAVGGSEGLGAGNALRFLERVLA